MAGAFKNKLLFSSGRVTNHRSVSRPYRMYFPLLDQSYGILLKVSCTTSFSSWAPSEFFKYKSTLSVRFELNTKREASGLQIGVTSKPGSKVSLLALWPCNS